MYVHVYTHKLTSDLGINHYSHGTYATVVLNSVSTI